VQARWVGFFLKASFFLTLALAVGVASVPAARITVGPNVQVSKTRGQMVHNEVIVAADPGNPDHLLGCSILTPANDLPKYSFTNFVAPRTSATIAYVSFDGGNHWAPALEVSRGNYGTDPSCAMGPDGRAYFAAIVSDDKKFDEDNQEPREFAPRMLFLNWYSKDGGKTWEPSAMPQVYDIDREYLVVDDTGGKYNGRVYVHGQRAVRGLDGGRVGSEMLLMRSQDGGEHFDLPATRKAEKPNHRFQVGNSVVLSDGTLAVAFSEGDDEKEFKPEQRNGKVPNGSVKIAFSYNGGDTLSKAVKISDLYADVELGGFGVVFPNLAVDRHEPFKDRLYAVWADHRSGRAEVWFSSSYDKGKTWSKPLAINDDHSWEPVDGKPPGPNDVKPEVAVNHDGVVGVSWYDRRDCPDGAGYFVRFSASLDGGETWLPSIRVSEAANTVGAKEKITTAATVWGAKYAGPEKTITINLGRAEWIQGGDTAGLAADAGGRFHPFWVDNRTGIHQVWTASVTVQGRAVRNGSAQLADLEDISSRVAVELTNSSYDEEKHVVRMTVALRNISEETIRGPVKMRAIRLKSGESIFSPVPTGGIGDVAAANADNNETGPGAVWDFTSLVPGSGLVPNGTSGSKHLVFQLSNVRLYHEGVGEGLSQFHGGMVSLQARILGQIEHKEPTAKKKE
jgi:BNR/Asp-box repeat